jgi:nickel-type superoxide dismutase maturation protease
LFGAATALAVVAIRLRPFRVEIQGGSMRPALLPGDWCIAIRARRVRPGDVVILERPHRPGLEVVKRIDRAEGGGWFVLGENPVVSTDSRHFGPVAPSAIIGRIRLVYWPPRRWRLV